MTDQSCSAFADPLAIELADITHWASIYCENRQTSQKVNLRCAIAIYAASYKKLHATS